MGQKTLEQLRSDLVGAFEAAVEYGKENTYEPEGAENLKAAAQLAQAILAIDDKIEQRQAEKTGMKLPGKV